MLSTIYLLESNQLDKEIKDWIRRNVPQVPPHTAGPYNRCLSYAAALAVIHNGTVMQGKNTRMFKGDTSHFWTVIDGKQYDPTRHWYPGGKNVGGVELDIEKNRNFFDKDLLFKRLTKK